MPHSIIRELVTSRGLGVFFDTVETNLENCSFG
jgi:hypothetical protein